MTTNELIQKLQEHAEAYGGDDEIVITTGQNKEFDINQISSSVGYNHDIHVVLELKEIKDFHCKWFRTHEEDIIIESEKLQDMKKSLQKEFGDDVPEEYQKIVSDQENRINYLKTIWEV